MNSLASEHDSKCRSISPGVHTLGGGLLRITFIYSASTSIREAQN